MEKKAVSGIVSTLLLISAFTLAFNIQGVKGWTGTVYIRADGSIDPPDAPISSVDNVTYTFSDSVFGSIVVERNDIVIDGAGNTLQAYYEKGIDLGGRTNVTVRNTQIKHFDFGIWLSFSSNNSISGNNITASRNIGIALDSSSNNIISGNSITNNDFFGIWLSFSSNNSISGNNITNNGIYGIKLTRCQRNRIGGNNITASKHNGIGLDSSSNNSIIGNKLRDNDYGVCLEYGSTCNSVSGNDITNNGYGIRLTGCQRNSINGNSIAKNLYGIEIAHFSQGNSINGNSITASMFGIYLYYSSNYNSIIGNSVTNNDWGIFFEEHISYNRFYHNNLIDNSQQFSAVRSFEYSNVFDDGYPSGGNYWSDYITRYPSAQELDDSGIWDTPYVLDENNKDNYPLVGPWTPSPPVVTATIDIDPDTLNLRSKGKWITAYIELPDGYKVSDIDVSILMLNDVVQAEPGHTAIGDHDSDGIPDLTVKFDRRAVISHIYNQRIRYGNVNLTVTGKLNDGTLFEGSDGIKVIFPDLNNDRDVDICDLIIVIRAFRTKPSDTRWNPVADINKDNHVNICDLSLVIRNYGAKVP